MLDLRSRIASYIYRDYIVRKNVGMFYPFKFHNLFVFRISIARTLMFYLIIIFLLTVKPCDIWRHGRCQWNGRTQHARS